MAIIKKIDTNKCWEDVERSEALYFLSGTTNGGPILENCLTIPPKVKHKSYHMTLQIKNYVHTKMDIFIAALFIIDKKWHSRGPWVKERRTPRDICYPAEEMKEGLVPRYNREEVRDRYAQGRSQSQRTADWMTAFTGKVQNRQIHTDWRLGRPGRCCGGEMGSDR